MMIVKITKNILALVAAIATWLVVGTVLDIVFELLKDIPIIGNTLYFRAVLGWAEICTVTPFSIYAGAFVSLKIANNADAFCVIMALMHLLSIISMFVIHAFSFTNLMRCLFGISAALTFFGSTKKNIQ